MKIYLDNCCLNRPFDDQSSLIVRFETEAILDIQDKVAMGKLLLSWSYVLDFENNANPFVERHVNILQWRNLANSFTQETQEIIANMNELMMYKLKPIDPLHVACARELKCDYFLTVDKGILKRANSIKPIIIMNPVNFVMECEQ